MSSTTAPGGEAFVAPLQPALMRRPLDFLAAERARQTVLLAHLERLARERRSRATRGIARALLRWLAEELPLHLADEEQSLHPRLRPHADPDLLRRLAIEKGRDRLLAFEVLPGLRRLAGGEPAQEGFAAAALGFTALHRRHMELEQAEVAPLARRCLTAQALEELAAEMAARRTGGTRTPCPTAP